MPPLHFSGSAMIWFQFVFAAITPLLIAGSVLGRMNFKAWMIFVPIWSTIVYSVGAFSLWGGGWLAQRGCGRLLGRLRHPFGGRYLRVRHSRHGRAAFAR